ncbi:tetratricopeptide repeat protein, partial [Escherichia coli]|nr:tetratricopeptide repeat protein [Escherichia coli]
MKTFILLITALTFAIPHASSQPPEAAAQTPAWVQKFNTLPEETRKQYIGKFQEAERFFAQKRTLESLFSLLELEKIFDGNPGLYNLRGACYIEIRNIEKALENFEKALKLDPENLT